MAQDDTDQALVEKVLEALPASNKPGLGDEKRENALDQSQINRWISSLNEEFSLSDDTRKFLHALVLLWNDFLEPSHSIVQSMGHPEASYIHGMMHRREEDFGNAKYWFRRAYPLDNQSQFDTLITKYISDLNADYSGEWEPAKFVDQCQKDIKNPNYENVQAAEFMAMSHYVISNN